MSSVWYSSWHYLRKWLVQIVFASFIVGLATYGVLVRLDPAHFSHFSYVVSLSQREASPDFSYDGYYALQATDLFTATLAQWSTTPEVIASAYEQAGIELPADGEQGLRQAVRAEKTAPQLIKVTVRGVSEAEVQAIAAALRRVLADNISTYHAEGIPELAFRAVATDEWLHVEKPAATPIAVATTLASFILLVNGTLLIGSLKTE